ncbi:hypothetical protein WJX84_007968, partial [Apatococcus fuscideae]
MSQKLSSKFPQTKTSGSRQGKPSSKRQKVSNGAVPSIPTPAKTSSVQPVQLYGEEEAQCLKQFDLTSRFGPCTGMSRTERWERADKMGTEPTLE